MAQLIGDVVNRVAYEVGDEAFDIVKRQSMLYDLDRVYRKYCEETRVLTGMVRMYGDGVSMDFDLYGPVFDSNGNPLGFNFGDNVYQFYRIEVNGQRASEVDFDYILNNRSIDQLISYQPQNPGNNAVINYAIKQLGKYLHLYLIFILGQGDYIDFWYYETPVVGSISDPTQGFKINDRNVDDLCLGLAAIAWRRMFSYYVKMGNADAAKLCDTEYKETRAQWENMILMRKRDVAKFAEEITPTVQQVQADYIDQQDLDLFESDYSGYD